MNKLKFLFFVFALALVNMPNSIGETNNSTVVDNFLSNLKTSEKLRDKISNGRILRIGQESDDQTDIEMPNDADIFYENIYYMSYKSLNYKEINLLKDFILQQLGSLKDYASIKYDFWSNDFWKVFQYATAEKMFPTEINPKAILVAMNPRSVESF